jgi:prolyl-tRNA synthetase
LQYVIVEADTGAMGGSASNEFMVYTNAGEDMVASCAKCGYAANTEKAQSRIPVIADENPDAPFEKFPTPGVRTIEDLVTFPGGAAAERQIKTLVYVAVSEKGKQESAQIILALLRGDHPLNDAKLASEVGALLRAEGAELTQLRPAHPEEIFEAMGARAGSLGAVGVTRYKILADNALQRRANMTTGANVDDHHLRGVNIARDIKNVQWVDLRTVAEGEGCPFITTKQASSSL